MRHAAELFKALSDEIRLRIVALLAHGELCVCDLTEVLELPQSTVSRHLSVLRRAGLVVDRRQGVWSYYRLAGDAGTVGQRLLEIVDGGLDHVEQAQNDRERLEKLLADKKRAVC